MVCRQARIYMNWNGIGVLEIVRWCSIEERRHTSLANYVYFLMDGLD